jgi:predicted membrane protein
VLLQAKWDKSLFNLKKKSVSSKMEGSSVLIWGMVFGAIGLGFFTYGKRQKAIVPLFTGIALFIFPYFMSNVYMLVIVGVILMMLPYFVRI